MAAQGEGRIAFVVTSLRDGDDDPSMAWMTWFADAGYDVTAVPVLPGPVSETLRSSVTVAHVAAPAHRGRIGALRTLIEGGAFDAVVAVRTYPNLVALGAVEGLPVRPLTVIAEENPLSLYLDDESRPRRRHVRAARRSYGRADLAVSASHPIAAELTAAFGVPASRSLVVPRPVLAERRTPVASTHEHAADEPIRLVLTCELSPRTEPQLALHAARALGERGISTEVVSLRGGPLEADLGALASAMGVPFEVRHDFEAADWGLPPKSVVVLPSRSDGLGAELIQATSRGIPATAISTALGVADAIIPGVTGELALDSHPHSLADAVERASKIKVTDIDGWVERFTPQASGALLERALRYGNALAEH